MLLFLFFEWHTSYITNCPNGSFIINRLYVWANYTPARRIKSPNRLPNDHKQNQIKGNENKKGNLH